MQNNIKDFREAKGWSMDQLAKAAGTTKSTINRLEKGVTPLDVNWLEKLGKALGVDPLDLIRSEPRQIGLSEDASPYDAVGGTKFLLTDTQFLYVAKTYVLDQLAIIPGTVLVVDTSKKEMENIRSGSIVTAQVYKDMNAVTIIRQFIEPNLLITNSIRENLPPINLLKEDVVIKGVVISTHNERRVVP